jgi:hypothetical protein
VHLQLNGVLPQCRGKCNASSGSLLRIRQSTAVSDKPRQQSNESHLCLVQLALLRIRDGVTTSDSCQSATFHMRTVLSSPALDRYCSKQTKRPSVFSR